MASTSNDRSPSSPPAQAAQPAAGSQPTAGWRPSRWLTLVGVAGVLFLSSNVAGIVYFSNRSSAQPVARTGEKAAEIMHSSPSNGSSAQPVARTPTAAPTKTANDRLLEALGCQSAVHLYQSYLNIGLIADAVAHKTCTLQEGSNLLSTVAGLMDVVDKQLKGLDQLDFREEEKEGVQRIRAISSLLRVQLASLQAYWLSGDGQHRERYHSTREQAWSELSKILGL